MTIGILYESDEWSSYALNSYIQNSGLETCMINTEEEIPVEKLLSCSMIVNRVFASAQFRGHQKSLERVPGIISLLKEQGIPMINPYDAHAYEVNKGLSTKVLGEYGIAVPTVFGVCSKSQIPSLNADYPFIIKPNCGGRTNYTYIIHDADELQYAMDEIPDIEMIVEEYIEPVFGYLTRIEVIDGECRLILKRSVASNGLSAYHLGSTYQRYDDCNEEIKETAVRAMDLLEIQCGSLDIIENERGFFIIDVNSVSNVSEDNTELFQFDLMQETAKHVVKKYKMGK